MAEHSPQIQEGSKEEFYEVDMERSYEVSKEEVSYINHVGMYGGIEAKPTKSEVLVWYFYGLCSYFVHTVLIPIVFPLIISQTVSKPTEPPQGWLRSYKDMKCNHNEMFL